MGDCCKGKNTNFCSTCGRKIANDSSAAGLLNHINYNLHRFEMQVERLNAIEEKMASQTRRLSDARRNAEKWASWADIVAQIVWSKDE